MRRAMGAKQPRDVHDVTRTNKAVTNDVGSAYGCETRLKLRVGIGIDGGNGGGNGKGTRTQVAALERACPQRKEVKKKGGRERGEGAEREGRKRRAKGHQH